MQIDSLSLSELYEQEYDQWLEETVKLLRSRQLEQLDYENLIEELEVLGRSEKNAVKSLLLQVIIHLLLLQFWTKERERNANHWSAEIITFRVQLEDRLTTNLRNYLMSELDNIYDNACLIVNKKAQLTNLPEESPYSLDQLLQKDWFPEYKF
ncbi:MAG: DUF29 domain-containing protein [Crocosphaera sp.]|jgi:hypothetical protein